MKSILALCVLAFAISTFVRGEPLAEADSLKEMDARDESNDFEMQGAINDINRYKLEMPILRGHRYPFCKVRYQACKVVVNNECKCRKLEQCCENCFRRGVFCRALPEVCLWVSLRCQCRCQTDASNRSKKC